MVHCFFVQKIFLKNFQKHLAKMSLSVGIGERANKNPFPDIEN